MYKCEVQVPSEGHAAHVNFDHLTLYSQQLVQLDATLLYMSIVLRVQSMVQASSTYGQSMGIARTELGQSMRRA